MSVLVLLYCASFFLLIFLLDSLEYMACTVFKGSSWSKKLILLAVYQVIASNTSLYSLPIFSQPKLYNSRWSQNTFSYPATYTIQSVQRKCSTGYMLLFYLFYFIYVCCTCMGFFVRICFSSFFLFFFPSIYLFCFGFACSAIVLSLRQKRCFDIFDFQRLCFFVRNIECFLEFSWTRSWETS